MKKRILRALGVLLLFALMLAEIERYEYIESNKKIVYQSRKKEDINKNKRNKKTDTKAEKNYKYKFSPKI